MLSPTLRSWSVSFEALNSCVVPSFSVTATTPCVWSTRTTLPSTCWRAPAFICSQDCVVCPAANPAHSGRASMIPIATALYGVMNSSRPLVLGDVVDGAGGRADTRTDERALAGPVAGSGADRGARARADRRAAQGPARRRDERNQGQPDHGGEDSRLRRLLGHGAPPACGYWQPACHEARAAATRNFPSTHAARSARRPKPGAGGKRYTPGGVRITALPLERRWDILARPLTDRAGKEDAWDSSMARWRSSPAPARASAA